MLDLLFEALVSLFNWPTFPLLITGLIIGIIAGALPGIGASLGMAIILPLTLPLAGIDAIVLLVSVYSGAMYGGSISAILMNVPGTAGAAATTFDGYPMARQGKSTTALSISATASAVGGSVSLVLLILLIPVLIELVLAFGSPEYFLVAIVGLSMITVVAKSSIIKGLMAGGFGMLLATVGMAPTFPQLRFTFQSLALYNGLNFIAVLIGLFAIAEMLKLAEEEGSISKIDVEIGGKRSEGVLNVLTRPIMLIKSALIGMGVGIIPGAGSSIANFVSYAEGMRSSKDSDSWGKGNPEGIVATEASNNGSIGGSLIPTLAFGIPGSGATAVLLGGLVMHGLRPGPLLFTDSLDVTYAILLSILLGNGFILLIGLSLIPRASFITRIDTDSLIPIIIVFAMLGGMSIRNNWVDVITIVVVGILGYYMIQQNFSVIAMILGVILGPIAEENLARSLQISGGSFDIFITRPISIFLVFVLLIILSGPLLGTISKKLRSVS